MQLNIWLDWKPYHIWSKSIHNQWNIDKDGNQFIKNNIMCIFNNFHSDMAIWISDFFGALSRQIFV